MSSDATTCVDRRRLLAALGTATVGSLAGCSGRLPGTGPDRTNTETTVDDGRVRWQYPPRDGDRDGIGYAAVEVDPSPRRGDLPPSLDVEFTSTVGRVAAEDPHRGYRPDWFRFRVWPPESYEASLGYRARVEPPGQWEGFSTYYDVGPTVRRFVVELRGVETRGTITVPAVLDPGVESLPGKLHCSFVVQASRPGTFGRTVRVADEATVDVDGK